MTVGQRQAFAKLVAESQEIVEEMKQSPEIELEETKTKEDEINVVDEKN